MYTFWKYPNIKMHKTIIFSPTRPHWAELVSKSTCPCVCVSVCLCHRETPTSGGRADLWSKIAFLILVWDDTFSKKKRGVQFFGEIFWGGSKFFLRAILEGGPKSRVKFFLTPPKKTFFLDPPQKKNLEKNFEQKIFGKKFFGKKIFGKKIFGKKFWKKFLENFFLEFFFFENIFFEKNFFSKKMLEKNFWKKKF